MEKKNEKKQTPTKNKALKKKSEKNQNTTKQKNRRETKKCY